MNYDIKLNRGLKRYSLKYIGATLCAIYRSRVFKIRSCLAKTFQDKERYYKMSLLVSPANKGETGNASLHYIMRPGEKIEQVRAPGIYREPNLSGIYLDDGSEICNSDYCFANFSDAWITKNGYVSYNNTLILDRAQATAANWHTGNRHIDFYLDCPFASYDIKRSTGLVTLSDSRKPYTVFLFPTDNSQRNFGHFIHDTLLNYPLYKRLQFDLGEVHCAMAHDFKYPIQKEIIQSLFKEEIKKNMFHQKDIEGRYKNVIVPIDQFDPLTCALNIDAVMQLRLVLQDAARTLSKNFHPKSDELVFVSRKDGLSSEYGRSLLPHSQIEDYFRQQGFTILNVSALTVEELCRIFLRAKVVAGVHGAGLLNIMFSEIEKPILIELDTVQAGWSSIERVARSAGCHYKRFRPLGNDSLEFYKYCEIGDFLRQGL